MPRPDFLSNNKIEAFHLISRRCQTSLSPVQITGMGQRASTWQGWNETHSSGHLRAVYKPVYERLERLDRSDLQGMDERLEAAMREMGVSFDTTRDRSWGGRPWYCDLLPQIFTAAEWDTLSAGISQRLRAFEMFLHDIYGPKEILRAGTLPVQPVLGSINYQRAAASLKPPGGAYLHLTGLSLGRMPDGEMAVKHHYLSNASGISYMMQNRRALTRVIPQSFGDFSIRSIADTTTDMLEMLRSFSNDPDPTVVLLSSGPGSAVYSEHSFLARRMGIPLVQGGDLLVLNDSVYLKTVSGLEKVEIIYSRISDQWLDPMVFRRDSYLGVPGLVHCIRKGTVVVVNGIGSQLADDRALLPFASRIVRFYLGEAPLLKSVPTYWLGDIDQREMVLADLAQYTIRPLTGEKILLGGNGIAPTDEQTATALAEILAGASNYVAQPNECDAATICFHNGKPVERRQDHIVFALRKPDGAFEVFPGALTRVTTESSAYTASELGGGSKDTWVQAPDDWSEPPSLWVKHRETVPPPAHVTSRVAEAFYWMGRYLERANNLAMMIGVIEALELEELNPTERTLYRPVWNRILPPLESAGTLTRRNISSAEGRYRLCLNLDEPDSVVRAIVRAAGNAESMLESLSLEAWSVLSTLRSKFQRVRYRPTGRAAEDLSGMTRRLCDTAVQGIAQFFGIAQSTMIADGGWAFCEIGQLVERAVITANAVNSIIRPFKGRERRDIDPEHELEIRLSAFLRLLNSRDVYRRVYQMRIEPEALLDLLWKNKHAPRSITRCLEGCAQRFRAQDDQSPATERTLSAISDLLQAIRHTDWNELVDTGKPQDIYERGIELQDHVLDIHNLISDGFLNHQIHMRTDTQPFLIGLKHAV